MSKQNAITLGDSPAYPVPDNQDYFHTTGMTKRELMATVIMQGLCENPEVFNALSAESMAQQAIKHVDALIKELNREAQPE